MVLGVPREDLLEAPELEALDGKGSPHGPIFSARD